MAGYGHDTESLALTVKLPDETTVQITGENDGVNGFEWSGVHILPDGPVPIAVAVHHERLIDGITPAGCDCPNGWLWPMASDSDDAHPFVERCDDCQVFADDIVAAEALAATLEGGHVVMRPVHGDANRLQPAVYPCEGWTE
jgi:hypothetical protein